MMASFESSGAVQSVIRAMFQLESSYDAVKKAWSGRKSKDYFNPKITVGELVRDSLQRSPQRIGQICGDSKVALTNGEILLRSFKVGWFVQRFGLQIGDVAGVIAKNSENLAPVIFGLCFCGLSINTLDTSFNKDEIIGLFKYTLPKLVFCDADNYTTVKTTLMYLANDAPIFIIDGILENSNVVCVDCILREISDADSMEFRPNEPDDGRNHTAFILCSSGTTGPSKGVCLPHSALVQQPLFRYFCESDNFLCFSSLYWLSGVVTLIIGTISGATRIISTSPFHPESMLRFIEQYKVTKLLSPPSQLAMALQHPHIKQRDLSSLQTYFCGGSHVSPLLCDQMQEYLPSGKVWVGYGLTEIGGICNLNSVPQKLGSVGKLVDNIAMKVIDEEGKNLAPNQKGEICMRVPYKFTGYSGREIDMKDIVDSGDWIHSGDIGYFDDDGFLFIIDRKKDILKFKGYQYSPAEIEIHLQSLPGVEQVCVCGVSDPILSDLPAALVVCKSGFRLTEEEVHHYLRSRLSDAKQLRGGVHFVDSIPMTASGKYQRNKAKNIATKMYKANANYISSFFNDYQ